MLALVAAVVGWPQVAGAGEPQWAPMDIPMWCYLCWLPPVGHTMTKWQCVATRGQGGTAALVALVAAMGSGLKEVGVGEHHWGPKGAPNSWERSIRGSRGSSAMSAAAAADGARSSGMEEAHRY